VDEQLIFQLDSIQLFLSICQQERIRYIFLRKLKEYIQFNIQQRSNQLLFFLLEHIKLPLILNIQQLVFSREHIQFLILL